LGALQGVTALTAGKTKAGGPAAAGASTRGLDMNNRKVFEGKTGAQLLAEVKQGANGAADLRRIEKAKADNGIIAARRELHTVLRDRNAGFEARHGDQISGPKAVDAKTLQRLKDNHDRRWDLRDAMSFDRAGWDGGTPHAETTGFLKRNFTHGPGLDYLNRRERWAATEMRKEAAKPVSEQNAERMQWFEKHMQDTQNVRAVVASGPGGTGQPF